MNSRLKGSWGTGTWWCGTAGSRRPAGGTAAGEGPGTSNAARETRRSASGSGHREEDVAVGSAALRTGTETRDCTRADLDGLPERSGLKPCWRSASLTDPPQPPTSPCAASPSPS